MRVTRLTLLCRWSLAGWRPQQAPHTPITHITPAPVPPQQLSPPAWLATFKTHDCFSPAAVGLTCLGHQFGYQKEQKNPVKTPFAFAIYITPQELLASSLVSHRGWVCTGNAAVPLPLLQAKLLLQLEAAAVNRGKRQRYRALCC